MTELQASRTLVKSPPELWAECSDAASLARHLDRFGDIRITRLDPETAVAWEGERTRGTVRIEPAGWGTKVILTAVSEGEEPPTPEPVEKPPPPEPIGESEAEMVTAAPTEEAPRRGGPGRGGATATSAPLRPAAGLPARAGAVSRAAGDSDRGAVGH